MSPPSIVRSTASRTLHLHLTPRVQNVGESRSILRLLQQFGEVEYFKHLKHDLLSAPQTILCVFKDDETAQRVLNSSPLSFKLAKSRDSSALRGFAQEESERLFQLRAQSARVHLRDQINMSHFHGPFGLDTKSAPQGDLLRRVPIIGQSDLHWRAEQKPWKVLAREQKERETRVRLMDLWEDSQKAK
nr:hypothetical protein CFP56_54418 [Quercus suber]